MKIAFLNIYQDSVSRGAETYISELSKRLRKNHRVDIISGGETNVPEWKKSFLWRAFLDTNSRKIASFTLKKISRLWKEKYDVVIPVNGGWQPAFVRIITWLYGGKMVVSGQSGRGWHERNNLWSFPDAFVALSLVAKDWARKVTPFVKSVYIPNGVDLKKFVPGKNRITSRTVLCVGAFTEQKRLDLVVRAVAKLKEDRLVIAGAGGEKRKDIEALGKRLLTDRFKLISVPFAKMPEIYRNASLFTLSSLPTEAFGNVLVEAMATNLPVVATDDPIRREIVGDAGILVDPVNTEKYAEALKQALERNWENKPRHQAEKFDWDIVAQKYEKLFQDLAS